MRFFVPGIPVAQGSKRHVGKGIMVEASKNLTPWRDSIIYHARSQQRLLDAPRFDEMVVVRLSFRFLRPKAHYGTGRNERILKATAPTFKASAPDLDKLVRAVLDALVQAGVLRDDALVVHLYASKGYTEQEPGVHVEVLSI